MTRLLDQAVAALRDMPPAEQDDIARFLLDVTGGSEPAEIPSEDMAAVSEGLAQADRGEFASEQDVAAAFRKFER